MRSRNSGRCWPRILPLIAFLIMSGFVYSCHNKTSNQVIKSPDGKLTVTFQMSSHYQPEYLVIYEGKIVLEPSKLGLVRDDEDFSQKMNLTGISDVQEINEEYQLNKGKRFKRRYQANERTFHLTNSDGQKMDVIFRVSNDGVAFRYFFPGSGSEVKMITDEVTTFNFPDSAKAWLQPMDNAKTGYKQTNPSYEEHYMQDITVGTPSPNRAGWVYPGLFKSGKAWVLITESALGRNYCGTRLAQQSPGGEYSVDFPQKGEAIPGGVLKPHSKLPWSTPWRVLAIGSLKTIMESTLGTDLAPPAVKMDNSFIKPGYASWSWALLKDGSINYDTQKRFIDYASDMNWQYCLVDVNWDTTIGYDKIEKLANYAKSKEVGLILWYNSSGSWNNTTYHPKSKLLTHADREKEFTRLENMGIKGIKVDFFGGDGQSMIDYYQDIFEDAAKHHLLVNCHGATIPRGWQRTYPNLMTMEAVMGFEYVTFTQENADLEANHAAMLPFARNVFDPMDYTPMCLYEIPGQVQRKTTPGFELSLPILFLSGIQHMAETPRGMSHVPGYVKDFLRELPAQWDDSRYISGYPGKWVVIARKAGGQWYVAGINGEAKPRDLKLDLSFLSSHNGQLITDGLEKHSFKNETIDLQTDGQYSIHLKANGGFVMLF